MIDRPTDVSRRVDPSGPVWISAIALVGFALSRGSHGIKVFGGTLLAVITLFAVIWPLYLSFYSQRVVSRYTHSRDNTDGRRSSDTTILGVARVMNRNDAQSWTELGVLTLSSTDLFWTSKNLHSYQPLGPLSRLRMVSRHRLFLFRYISLRIVPVEDDDGFDVLLLRNAVADIDEVEALTN